MLNKFFLRVWSSLYFIKNDCLPNYKVKSVEKRNNNVVEQDTTNAEHEMILESLCLLLFRKNIPTKDIPRFSRWTMSFANVYTCKG